MARTTKRGSHTRNPQNIPLIANLGIGVLACCLLCSLNRFETANLIGAIPLILALPGSLLVFALDPFSRFVEGIDRLLWSVGSSVGIAVSGGFVLNALGGLSRWSFLVYLASVALLGELVALARSWRAYRSPKPIKGNRARYSQPRGDEARFAFGIDRDADIESGWDSTVTRAIGPTPKWREQRQRKGSNGVPHLVLIRFGLGECGNCCGRPYAF